MPVPGSRFGSGEAPWKSVLVYGLGVSGIAASRLFLERGAVVVAADDGDQLDLPSDLLRHANFVLLTISNEESFRRALQDAEVVVLSPGVPKTRALVRCAVAMGRPVLAEVEGAYRCLLLAAPNQAQRLVGITGSNGKSTTTEMVSMLLGTGSVACGNIGLPLSDCVRKMEVHDNVEPTLVVELSSFQLDDIDRFRVPGAALLNISPDHQDRHGSVAAYVEAKRRIFLRQAAGDMAVLNADDDVVAATRLNAGVRRRTFSLTKPVEDGCYLSGGTVFLVEPESEPIAVFEADDLAVVGEHNLANAMAAVLLAVFRGLDPASVGKSLGGFSGLPHRTQLVASDSGVQWYDDSKGTNVGATAKSLDGFSDGSVHLIAGGLAKGGDFSLLRESVAAKVACLYLVGEAAEKMEHDLGDLAKVVQSGTIRRAVASAAVNARPGQVVLLSPACASFDQFEGFSHRGRFFQERVRSEIAAQEKSRACCGGSDGGSCDPDSSATPRDVPAQEVGEHG